jgi:hypothetical protein
LAAIPTHTVFEFDGVDPLDAHLPPSRFLGLLKGPRGRFPKGTREGCAGNAPLAQRWRTTWRIRNSRFAGEKSAMRQERAPLCTTSRGSASLAGSSRKVGSLLLYLAKPSSMSCVGRAVPEPTKRADRTSSPFARLPTCAATHDPPSFGATKGTRTATRKELTTASRSRSRKAKGKQPWRCVANRSHVLQARSNDV